MSDRRIKVPGVDCWKLKQKHLIFFDFLVAFAAMRRLIDDPKVNVNQFKATNHYRKLVTQARGAALALGKTPQQLEDMLDDLMNTVTGGPSDALIPNVTLDASGQEFDYSRYFQVEQGGDSED